MQQNPQSSIPYKSGRFSARLPMDRLYTSSHFWLQQEEPGVWRIGFTKFATRMLGDLVEFGFGLKPGEPVEVGQAIGWVEGFKALTDLYSMAAGQFLGANPALDEDITLLDSDPHGEGWLYRVRGSPEPHATDVQGYIGLLDQTIEKLKEQGEGGGDPQ